MSDYARVPVFKEDCFGFEEIIYNKHGNKDKVKCTALSEIRNKDCYFCKFYKTKEQFNSEVEKSKKRIVLSYPKISYL